MIDWFASKISILIFLAAAISLLMFFGMVQIDILDQSKRAGAANDLARMSDGMCEGCSFTYTFERNYTVKAEGNTITVEGVSRSTLGEFESSETSSGAIRVEKEGGMITIYGQ